jgi:hypothetical protein
MADWSINATEWKLRGGVPAVRLRVGELAFGLTMQEARKLARELTDVADGGRGGGGGR